MRAAILSVCACVLSMAGCGDYGTNAPPTNGHPLVGYWLESQEGILFAGVRTWGGPFTDWSLTINSDTTFSWERWGETDAGIWTADDKCIRFARDTGKVESWPYELAADTLVILDYNTDGSYEAQLYKFIRQ